MANVSVVIISYNTCKLLRSCLSSVLQHKTSHPIEILVVDNGSKDGSAEMVEESFPTARLIRNNTNRGYPPACKQAQEVASGDYILLLNSDAELSESAIDTCVEFMNAHEEVGVCGAQLMNSDDTEAPSCGLFPSLRQKLALVGLARTQQQRTHHSPVEVDWVVGAFFFIRRETMQQVGTFDERFFFYFDEADFCRRSKQAGWKTYHLPQVKVSHLVGGSSRSAQDFDASTGLRIPFYAKGEKLYFRKHHGLGSVVAGTILDVLLYSIVYLRNLPSRAPFRKQRRQLAASWLVASLRAAGETRWGAFSPPPPW